MTQFSLQEKAVSPIRLEHESSVAVADFEAIVDRFQRPITRFIFFQIKNQEEANDLAQDTFLKAYKSLIEGTKVHEAALSAWIYRIASNTVTDVLRRRKLITWYPLSLIYQDRGNGEGIAHASELIDDSGSEGGQNVVLPSTFTYTGGRFEEQIADREIVEQIFLLLPRGYARCLWLYEKEGLSCQEIGKKLNISSSAVKMRLMRARDKVRTIYIQQTTSTSS